MKVLYNTTFSMPCELEEKFTCYMKAVYIPAMTRSGVLSFPLLSKILSNTSEEGLSYALQFVCSTQECLERHLDGEGDTAITELLESFRGELVGFSTVMEIVPL